MDSQTRAQLKESILDNGWTRPIIIHTEDQYIIDGEQRWSVAGWSAIQRDADLTPPDVPAGYVPVFGITVSESHAKVGTVQHNRAVGSQEPDRLKDFIEQSDVGLLDKLEDKTGFSVDTDDLTTVEDMPDEVRPENVLDTADYVSTEASHKSKSETNVVEFAMTQAEFDELLADTSVADHILKLIEQAVENDELGELLDYTETELLAIESAVETHL